MRTFDEPKSVSDAKERMGLLSEDIEVIESQLRDKNKKNDAGERMSSYEYKGWRNKATFALSCKINEYRFLNSWYRSNGGEQELANPGSVDEQLLMDAYRVMRNLGFLLGWKNIEPETQEIIDRVQFRLLTQNLIE